MTREINIVIYPNYDEVFDDGNEIKGLECFLKDIPTANVIQYVSFISACLDFKNIGFEIQNFILNELLGHLKNKEQYYISYKINSISKRPKIVFHHVACLLILQTSILNYKSGIDKIFSSDHARNILKAFLYCNSMYSLKMIDLIPRLKDLSDTEKKLGLAMTLDVAQKFFNQDKDIFEQSYKLNEFNEFIKSDNEIGGEYYFKFIKLKNIPSLSEIIKIIWNSYFKIFILDHEFDYKNIIFIINVKDVDKLIIGYFDSMSIKEIDTISYKNEYNEKDLDFKMIRERPLYKLNENQFVVMNSNLFADKIFHSLFFEYYNFIRKEGYNKSFGDFKSYYSEVFVEKYLLRKILDYMFEKNKFDIRQPGDILKIKDKYNRDYSDYYLRKGNKILLFECKDRIMKVDTKYSYDYKKVFEDVYEKFVVTAADQFLKILISISNREIPFDILEEKDFRNIEIIPIIVYTDFVYKSRGVNYYINLFFKEKLMENNLDLKVKDIIMIHIDTLINYQDLFHGKKVDFINILDRYNRFIKKNTKDLINKKDSYLYAFKDFDTYLSEYILRERKILYSEKSYVKRIYSDLYE